MSRGISAVVIETSMSTSSVERGSPLNELARDPPTTYRIPQAWSASAT